MHFFKLIFLLLVTTFANEGHRLGGDIYPPGNTLYAYQKLLANNQCDTSFYYAECDIRETKDGEIVVFHDATLQRVVPAIDYNREILKGISFDSAKIIDLSFETIQKLELENGAHIPSLKEVLDASVEYKLHRQLLIEIKSIKTDKARNDLIDLVASYRDRLWVNFLAHPTNYYHSFPHDYVWIPKFKQYGFMVYRTGKAKVLDNDLIRGSFYSPNEWQRSFLLKEQHFSFNKYRGRKQVYQLSDRKVPSGSVLRIGIHHGYDDTGDKGVTFALVDSNNHTVLSAFSDYQVWQWFDIPFTSINGLTLIVEDQDTSFKGKHPGNGGKVKVEVLSPR